MKTFTFIAYTSLLVCILLGLITCDLCFGSINLFCLESNSPLVSTILFDIRLPKTLTAIMAGSGLALCGLLMQSLFRNPLAGPYVLGVSSGASLFVAIATILLTSIHFSGFFMMGKSFITLFSVMGAFLVTSIILFVSKKTKSNVSILLIGLMLAQLLGAIESLIEFIGSADTLKTFIVWSMGSVGNTTLQDVFFICPIYALCIVLSFLMIKSLNGILLNEQYAQNLGININTFRVKVIIVTSLLVGIITAFCGPIAFVGISVPIASRLFFKTSHHKHQLVFCLLLGACVVVGADVICQLCSSEIMLPINTVTTLIGSPVVVYLLFKSKLQVG